MINSLRVYTPTSLKQVNMTTVVDHRPTLDIIRKGYGKQTINDTGRRSAVGDVSGYRSLEFDPGPVPYFRGD